MNSQKILYTIIIFLLVFLVVAGLSILFDIGNGVLAGIMLGAGTAIWYNQYYKKEESKK
jgi:thiosulfate reductase cytochrome b subunit